MKLEFTRSARRQYLDALAYVRRDDAAAARALNARVRASLERLIAFPASGRRIPEFPESPHREVIVGPYRFFYRATQTAIVVVAIWHGAQLAEAPERE